MKKYIKILGIAIIIGGILAYFFYSDIKEEVEAISKKEEVIENKPLRDEAVAIVRNAGVTPRKARLVIDLVRGKTLVEAYDILNNLNKAASPIVLKLIKSAEANAVNNFKMDPESLYIKTIYAGDGAKLKRYLPRAKGSASGLVKRLCNITVIISSKGAN